VKTHRVDLIYITLPMASQPRILKLLDELHDTTASIYFVPDIFLFDLIPGCGGLFDAEDGFGAWRLYGAIENKSKPLTTVWLWSMVSRTMAGSNASALAMFNSDQIHRSGIRTVLSCLSLIIT